MEACIDAVWNFYTDIKHLKVITPEEMRLEILQTSGSKIEQGAEFYLSANLFGGTKKWHSRITDVKEGAEYTDEMIAGPFKKWKHTHIFNERERSTIEVIDLVEIELPYGILGKIFERYAMARLEKIFEHRKMATRKAIEESEKI